MQKVIASHKKRNIRKFVGVVKSSKMDKTVVVEVERTKFNPKYQKQYKIHERFKAHDEKNQYKEGDRVLIYESRPISREKKWRVVKKI